MPEGTWVFSEGREQTISEAGIIGRRAGSIEGSSFYHHMSAKKVIDNVGWDLWDAYYKFTTIRNPFDKMVSAFFWSEKEAKHYPHSRQIEAFRCWLDYDSLINDSVSRWVFDRNKYVLGNDVCVDFFIRYENLEQDLMCVCKKLDVPWEPESLLKLKSGSNPKKHSYQCFYDEISITKVLDWFEFEFGFFGYSRKP